MESIAYRCVDCSTEFRIEVTDGELTGSLTRTHAERCPCCGQFAGKGRATCRSCGHAFELDYPHWHVQCDLATAMCPKCGVEHRSLCIC